MKKLFICVLMTLGLSITAWQANAQLTFKTTSPSTIAYYEYLPSDYNNNSNKYPVVIFLHGIGERGTNTTDKNVLANSIKTVAKFGPPLHAKNGAKFPFILIAPQLKNNYGTWPTSYVMEVINYVKTYLRIDEKRIVITGLSLGGGGTWTMAQEYPKLFSAVAPVCGGYNSTSQAVNIAKENVPVWASHGDKDTTVPMSKTVNMVNAINANKPNPLAKLTIYAGVNHNAWDYAYRTDHSLHNPNIYEWMMQQTNTKNGGNSIPTADANVDQNKSLATTNTATVFGFGKDSDGTIVKFQWTKIQGPDATMTGANTSRLIVNNLREGVYVFRLTVTDDKGNTDSDYMRINVRK
jgi:poly(3-hydroxybutyrate) depolymerase